MSESKQVTLFSATLASTTTTPAVSTRKGATKPITGVSENYTKGAFHLAGGTAAGTTPTLDAVIEGSVDGGTTYFVLTPDTSFTQITATGGEQVRYYEGLPPDIRAVVTIGGTSPTFTSASLKAHLYD
jgi:hypothetical protein